MATEYKLLPCPFCGKQPEVDRQGFRTQYEPTAWTFIRCTCRASPMVSGNVSTGYREYNRPWDWIETKTREQAEQQSYDWAVKDWNTRAPAEVVK